MSKELTLLAYLVPRLTNRVEDTATDALAYILNSSPDCRGALDDLLREGEGSFQLGTIASLDTQVTYEDGSRPDMVGYDSDGGKRLLVESKFWAALLEGQASGYFDQLDDKGPGVLMFVAPATRLEVLWEEIARQMQGGSSGVNLKGIETSSQTRRAKVAGSGYKDRRLMLVSWQMLLERMAASVSPGSQIAADIQQLRGLAQRQDDEAFQPIKRAELSPSVPRRLRWINRIIDDVVESRGVRSGWMSVSRRRATPQRDGYGRYFRFRTDQGEVIPGDLFLGVNYHLWATNGDTPLWLRIYDDVLASQDRLRDFMASPIEAGSNKGPYDVPIYLMPEAEYERVLNDVVRQVKIIWEIAGGRISDGGGDEEYTE